MKKYMVSRYIVLEILPHFFSSLAIMSAILVISQLMRLAEVLTTFGLSVENILLPFLFLLLPFLSFTIPISFTFSVLIAFSRLSLDGEFTALQAGGLSLVRVSKVVFSLAAVLFVVAAWCSLNLEPWGRRELVEFYNRKAKTELDHVLRNKLQSGVFLHDFLGFTLYAEKVSDDKSNLENVLLSSNEKGQDFSLQAPYAQILGGVETQDLTMVFNFGNVFSGDSQSENSSLLRFRRAELDLLRLFREKVQKNTPQFDFASLGPIDLYRYSRKDHADPLENRKAGFLLQQRISIPFAIISFCFFALVFGIQDARQAKSQSFALMIATIMIGYVLLMGFKWLAEQNYLASFYAAWIPHVLIVSCGMVLLWRKSIFPQPLFFKIWN